MRSAGLFNEGWLGVSRQCMNSSMCTASTSEAVTRLRGLHVFSRQHLLGLAEQLCLNERLDRGKAQSQIAFPSPAISPLGRVAHHHYGGGAGPRMTMRQTVSLISMHVRSGISSIANRNLEVGLLTP